MGEAIISRRGGKYDIGAYIKDVNLQRIIQKVMATKYGVKLMLDVVVV